MKYRLWNGRRSAWAAIAAVAASTFTVAVPAAPAAAAASTGVLDAAFNSNDDGTGTGARGGAATVHAIGAQSDGNVLVAGDFTSFAAHPRTNIARLDSSGRLDTSYAPAVNGAVTAVAVDEDDNAVIAGTFSTVGGSARSRIARIARDGSVDTTFAATVDGPVNTVVVQADGRIVIGGSFTTVNGTSQPNLARLDSDGALDTTFAAAGGPDGTVDAVAVDRAGNVVIGGNFVNVAGVAQPNIARLDSDGVLDTTFAPEVDGRVLAVAVDQAGTVTLGGTFNTVDGEPHQNIARLGPDTMVDTAYAVSVDGAVTDIAHGVDGTTVFAGAFTTVDGVARPGVARTDAAGTFDTAYGPGTADGAVNALLAQSDGATIVAGAFTTLGDARAANVGRIGADGTTDPTYAAGNGPNGTVRAVAVQASDQKIIAGGDFTHWGSTARARLVRLTAAGALDTAFAPEVNGSVRAIAIDSSGRIIIGGSFTTVNGTSRNRLARLNSDGTLDTGFVFNADGDVNAVAIDATGRIVIGGAFSTINGTTRQKLARITAAGALDTGPNLNINGNVNAVVIDTSSRPVIGGTFTMIGTSTRNRFARITALGALDTLVVSVTGGTSPAVNAITMDGTGMIFGGSFTTVATSARNNIARITSTGGLSTYNPNLNGAVTGIARQSDGLSIAVGAFTAAGAVTRNGLVRLSSAGALDTTFNPASGPDGTPRAIALQSDSNAVVGGEFTRVNGSARSRIARWGTASTPLRPTVSSTSVRLDGFDLSWTAPAETGSSAVSGYQVRYRKTGTETWTTDTAATTTYSATTASGTWEIQVAATNAAGTGWWSVPVQVHVPAVPGVPTISAVAVSATSAAVTFSAGAGDPARAFTVTCTADGATTRTATAGSSPISVTTLDAGATYRCTVRATNKWGSSAESAASEPFIPWTSADAPAGLSATAGDTEVALTWTPLTVTAAKPVSGYVVTVDGTTGCTATGATATGCTVTGLANGTTYSFVVYAYYQSTNGAASAAVTATPRGKPNAPTVTATTPADRSVTVTWDPPANNGGSAITGYNVYAYTDTGGTLATGMTNPQVSASTALNFVGLTNGTGYWFRVRAINSAGEGLASNLSTSTTPRTVPTAPTISSTAAGNQTVTVTWNAPADNGGNPVSSYTARLHTATDPATVVATLTGATTTATFTGLTNGTTYYVTVSATNGAGEGAASSYSDGVVPHTTPGAPHISATTADDGAVTVTWDAPADTGGAAISAYKIYIFTNTGGTLAGGMTNPQTTDNPATYTVEGLTNGVSYWFKVAAVNQAGESSKSAYSDATVPRTVPGAPAVTAVAVDATRATVTFDAPAHNGGAAISSYRATCTSADTAATSTATGTGPATLTVNTLNPGETYTCTVAAANAAGWGAESDPSEPFVPWTGADAPGDITATASNGSVTVTWTPMTATAAKPIAGYVVTVGSTTGCTAVGADASSCTVTGLTNGTAYNFAVYAYYQTTNGAASGTVSATPFTVPDAPGKPTAAIASAGTARVRFAETFNGGNTIVDYDVEYSTVENFEAGSGTFAELATTGAGTTTLTVTELNLGEIYYFRVRATNAAGDSAWSAASDGAKLLSPPSAPQAVVATVDGPGSIAVAWNLPADDGGEAASGFTVEISTNNVDWTVAGNASADALSWSATGLTPGTSYRFRVSASNSAGTSPASDPTASVMAVNAPDRPTTISVGAGNQSITATWSAVTSTTLKPVNSITVAVDGNVGCTVTILTTTRCTVTGLVNGQPYTVTVRANGPAGPSTEWTGTATPSAMPPAPSSISASVYNYQSIRVTYPLPTGLAAPATTQAQLSLDSGSTWTDAAVTGTISPILVTPNVRNVAQIVRVRLVVSGIAGPWSKASAPVKPYSVPGAPTVTSMVPADKKITLTFAAQPPGMLAAAGYGVQLSTDNGTTWATATTDGKLTPTVLGLTNGVRYQFKFRVRNAAGWSDWSEPSTTPRPYDTIAAPQVAVIARSGALDVAWTPVASTATRTVTGYRILSDTGATLCSTGSADQQSCSIEGVNGTTIRLRAVAYAEDLDGVSRTGTASALVSGTPSTSAAVQLAKPVISVVNNDEAVTVRFTAPVLVEGQTRASAYRAYLDGRFACQTTAATPTSCIIWGLTNGTTYQVVGAAVYADTEGDRTVALNATPRPWTAPPPSVMTFRVTGIDVTISATAPSVSGIAGYVITRDGMTVANTVRPVWLDSARATTAGTYTYTMRAVGPKGRLGDVATLTVTIVVPETPQITATTPARGTVVITPTNVTAVPAGSSWQVLRNGYVIKTVAITGTEATTLTLTSQNTGTGTYRLRLVTPTGTSGVSNGETLTIT